MKQFRSQDSLSAIDFSAGLMEAYEAGQIGDKTVRELADAEFAGRLTTGQREAAYNRGKRMGYKDAYRRQQDVKKKSGGKKEGKLHFDRKGRKFDSMRESSLAVMDTLAKALGVDIYVFESYVNEAGKRVYLSDRGEKNAPNGFYDPSDGSIHIDLNAGQEGRGTMLFTVSHELTHFIKDWSSVKYRALAEALVKQYQKNGESVSKLVDNQIYKADQNGRKISREEAFDEVVADSMESMLTDENAAAFLEKLSQRDKGLKEKIVSWLKELSAKLKNAMTAYKDVKPDSPEGKMVAEMEEFRKEIMGIYSSALVDARENFRENGININGDGAKYSIREIIGGSGKNYGKGVYLDSIILDKLSDAERINAVKGFIRKIGGSSFTAYDKNGIARDIIIAESRSRFKNAKGKSVQVNNHMTSFLNNPVKQEALVLVDEMITTSVFDGKEKANHAHGWLDNNGMNEWDVWKVYLQEKNKTVWEAILRVANTTNGEKILYEVYPINMVEAARKPDTSTTNGTVSQPSSVVKQKFTLSDRVEQTKNLVAVHNLTEDKLLSTLKLGGFPMPSIAVTKSDIPHTNFGEISLVFGRETIDPKANRKNTVYSADAWTPTFPKVEYEANSKVTSRVYERLGDLAGSVDQYFKRDLDRARYGVGDLLNRYGGEEELIKAVMDNYGLKAAYNGTLYRSLIDGNVYSPEDYPAGWEVVTA